MENKLGQESAFPRTAKDNGLGGFELMPIEWSGISTRLYLAGLAMQGLLGSGFYNLHDCEGNETYARKALALADELLKQENETNNN